MSRPATLKESLPGLRRIFLRLWPYIRRHRGIMVASLITLLLSVALRLLEPWPLKFVFDGILRTADVGKQPRFHFLRELDPMALLAYCAAAIAAVVALRAVLEYLSRFGFVVISNRVMAELRNDLYRHVQRLPLSFHARARSGDLILRVMTDVSLLRDIASTGVLPLAANVLILAGMWGLMLWVQWRLALLAAATLPLCWLLTALMTRKIRDAARRHRQREGVIAAAASESIGAIKTVQALGLEDALADGFVQKNKKSLGEDLKGGKLSAKLERSVDILTGLATAAVVYYGVRLVVVDRLMSPGDLLVFLAYLRRAFNPIQDFAKYTGRLAKASAAGERVLDLLDREQEIRDRDAAVNAGRLRGDVRFNEVTFGYEERRPVLRDVSFHAPPGSFVSIVGSSGVGKSTVANLLLRFYEVQSGQVLIDGRDVLDYTVASLRKNISMVLQESALFAVTVRENIAYGRGDAAAQEEIEAAARLANAHEFILALPEGYDTVLGERGVNLSSGQRQRLAIARAALRDAPVLILDEPTTGLDEENQRDVVAALRRLAVNRTTFLITHDLSLTLHSDVVLYLERGLVRESGTHRQLMDLGGRYATLFNLQNTLGVPPEEETHAFSR